MTNQEKEFLFKELWESSEKAKKAFNARMYYKEIGNDFAYERAKRDHHEATGAVIALEKLIRDMKLWGENVAYFEKRRKGEI